MKVNIPLNKEIKTNLSFSALLSIFYNSSLGFLLRPSAREGSHYMHSMHLFLVLAFLWVIFFSHIDSTLQSAIFLNFSFRLGLQSILLKCICPFLDYTKGSYYYKYDGSFKLPHFSILISGYLYSFILLFSFTKCHLLALPYELEGVFFF